MTTETIITKVPAEEAKPEKSRCPFLGIAKGCDLILNSANSVDKIF